MSTLPSKERLIALVAEHTCTRNCFGVAGYSSSCCKLGSRDFIQGPVRDSAEVLQRLSARFGRELTHEEVFVGFEEGRAMFPHKPRWQVEANYPALRPLLDASKEFPCRFLTAQGLCGVYEDRPLMCREYRCSHLKAVLDAL